MRWPGLALLVCGVVVVSADGPRVAFFESTAGNCLIGAPGSERGISSVPPGHAGRRFREVPARPPVACVIDFSSFDGQIG